MTGGRLAPGSVVALSFEIVRFIKEGGMGEVYEARSLINGERLAIKMIRRELVDEARIRALFLREAEILKRVRHDAVVGYGGLVRHEDGRDALVMDFIDGPSLAEVAARHPLDGREGTELLVRLAQGLEHVHAAGTFHRDLSPNNVLLPGGAYERSVIIDFGISKLADPDAGTLIGADTAGTYGYMSPEQLAGKNIDARSDIYGLALTVAMAVRGRPVDMGASWTGIVAARQRVPDLTGVPPPLRGWLETMLQPDPAARPASMREVLAMVDRGPGGLGTGVGRTAGGGAPPKQRWAIALAALAVLAGGGVLGTLYFTTPELSFDNTEDLTSSETGDVPTLDELNPDEGLASSPPKAESQADASLRASARDRPIDAATLGTVADVAGDVPCATLSVAAGPGGGLSIRGNYPSDFDVEAFRHRVAGISGVSEIQIDAALVPQPPCEALALADTLPAADAMSLDGAASGTVYAAGELLVFDLQSWASEPRHVSIDFFDPSGQVVHMRPNPVSPDTLLEPGERVQLGNPNRDPDERWYEVSAPFGNAAVLLIASSIPLFPASRPEVEDATVYLNDLRDEISRAGGGVEALALDIELVTDR